MEEQWRSVVGAEGLYEVSNLGRVRSLDRVIKFYRKGAGTITRKDKGQLLSPSLSGLYQQVQIRYSHQTTVDSVYVHRLVADAFVDNPKPDTYTFVNHLDTNKHNNNADNLEWTTNEDNLRHAWESGCIPKGEDKSNAVLTEDLVRWIRKNARSNGGSMTYVELAELAGVSRHQCSLVARGKQWKHVV